MKNKNIKIYDSTLRDGAQTKGVVFSFEDKLKISQKLDDFGVDYIEGGWPGANPTDDKFFKNTHKFKKSKLVAFDCSSLVLIDVAGWSCTDRTRSLRLPASVWQRSGLDGRALGV